MNASDGTTPDRILRAAEVRFARQGIGATSLRSIIVDAGVNLASVHYHFGSKNALTAALVRLRIGELSTARLRRLDALEDQYIGEPVPVTAILEAFVEPVFADSRGERRPSEEICFLARAFLEKVDEPQSRELHDRVVKRAISSLQEALTGHSYRKLRLRFSFLESAMFGVMLGLEATSTFSRVEDEALTRDVHELVQVGSYALQGESG